MRAFDAQVERLTVDALAGGTLVVDALEVLALAVKLVTNPSADAGGQAGDAANLLDGIGVMERTSGGALPLSHPGTAVAPDLMRDQAVTFLPEGGLERHGQPRLTERKSFRRESLAVSVTVGPGRRSKATGEMEVLVDIEGFVCLVESAETWFATVVALHTLHEGMKVALVEGLGELSQDTFGQFLDLGDDDAGGIAPVILALAQGRERLASRAPAVVGVASPAERLHTEQTVTQTNHPVRECGKL